MERWLKVPSQPRIMVSDRGRIMATPFTATMPNGGERKYGGVPGVGQYCKRRTGADNPYVKGRSA